MSSENKDSLISSFHLKTKFNVFISNLYTFCFFVFSYCFARTSSTVLNRGDNKRNLCFTPDLRVQFLILMCDNTGKSSVDVIRSSVEVPPMSSF